MTLNTPSGTPASAASSASRSIDSGDCSAGLTTIELPVASAGPIFQLPISSGKFQGMTAPTTPSGSRRISEMALARSGRSRHRSCRSPRRTSGCTGWRADVDAGAVADRLAHIQGLQQRQLGRVLLHQVGEPQQNFLALSAGDPGPHALVEGGPGSLHARSTSSLSPAETWVSALPVAGLVQVKVLPEAAETKTFSNESIGLR
jgi:hypothetical protein